MMRIRVALVVLCLGMAWAPNAATAEDAQNECPLVKPDHGRVCGTRDPELLQYVHESGGCFTLWVKAASKWNATGIRLQEGRSYEFEAGERKGWADAGLKSTAVGWTPEAKAEIAKQNWLVRAFIAISRPFRRAPDHEWFHLIGMVAEVGDHVFPIGNAATLDVDRSGEFCVFANDLPWKYGNNHGALKLTVRESPRQSTALGQ